ncbi:hypothetical protein BG53_01875 [Paenibacillus darwinianus]|uniref:Nucleotidyltransferase family protein n=1 Tax=Paenibacillus darwinianus TaxID=1380763 RepID=A0A9W5W7P5_9BACL|nr:nucleotidyltransferase family protein [Paenibacillus darwinianus]EXX87534.1 hypothetical protein BG52_03900 [Paenibacillus darwinianus]EXX88497.1 hypothetical protein BG53_01875 [Paenibacillus darwinianus]EXX88705.1 hypothetical protein CH50_02915 [Paenibacillus darwinianus]
MEQSMRKPLYHFINGDDPAVDSLYDKDIKPVAREIGVRNMFIQQRLYQLIASLREHGIPATVLKGSHLIHSIYPFGVRPVEDIDVLIDRKHFEQADRIIRAMGYEDTVIGMDMWVHQHFSNKITYLGGSHPVIPIDVHFSLGPYPYLGKLDSELLSGHTLTLDTPECPLTILRHEALLLHLCLHLFQHHFDDWQVSCCDIIAVMRRYRNQIDWELFVRLVRQTQTGLPVLYSLRKAAELSAPDVPDRILAELAGTATGVFEKWVFRAACGQTGQSDRYLLQFLTTPGFTFKLRCAFRIVFPGQAFLLHYHKGSYWHYLAGIIKTTVHHIR